MHNLQGVRHNLENRFSLRRISVSILWYGSRLEGEWRKGGGKVETSKGGREGVKKKGERGGGEEGQTE